MRFSLGYPHALLLLAGVAWDQAAALPAPTTASTAASSSALDTTSSSSEVPTGSSLPKPQVPVTTVTTSSSVYQEPARPSHTPNAKALGFYPTVLQKDANPTVQPFPTENPPSVGNINSSLSKTVPTTTYSTPVTVSGTYSPLNKRTERISEEKEEKEEKEEESKDGKDGNSEPELRVRVAMVVLDIFTPIATTSPIALFSRRPSHPVARTSITDTNKALHTNKFYANLFLGGQTSPVFTFPYQLWFNKTDPTWGFSFNHANPGDRGYGPADGPSSAVEYYVNGIYVNSLSFSASEFSAAKSTLELKNLAGQSVDAYFYANKAVSGASSGYLYSPLCLGMGFVSGVYNNLTPVFNTAVLVRSLARRTATLPNGAVKYGIVLEDNSLWLVYAFANTGTPALNLAIVNNGLVHAGSKFSGLIQVAKLTANATTATTTAEAALDAAAGSYCSGVNVTGQVAGTTGNYQLNFAKSGPGMSELLMYALPHHIKSFAAATTAKVCTALQLPSTTKGMMTGVVANQWSLMESSMPTSMGYLPVPAGGSATFSAANLKLVASVATSEIAQDMIAQTNLTSMYFSGKALAKFAYVCLTANDVLKDTALTKTCLTKLQSAWKVFANNQQMYKLVYDQSWRGVLSNALYVTNDPNSDFGSGYYNDHHFHYSYFIQTAAIIGRLDNGLYKAPTWLGNNKDYVSTLIRDVANPSAADVYFPVFRSFDWFHGHSWAKGLFDSLDGKDEESSSEDVNFAYAMKLWGNLVGDTAMEARGNLMLAVLKRSLNEYFLLSPGNVNHPANFVPNMVSGILFENKVHHTTYFGTLNQYIQGIHMLPLTPASPYIRSATFAQQEWNVYFNGKTSSITDGWKGVLYANQALWDPKVSWRFFNQSNFNSNWLDGGSSRTWYLAFAGGLGGAAT